MNIGDLCTNSTQLFLRNHYGDDEVHEHPCPPQTIFIILQQHTKPNFPEQPLYYQLLSSNGNTGWTDWYMIEAVQ